MELYHVCDDWNGEDLVPLGDEEEFLKRWPDSGNLGHYHAHVVHLWSSLEQALDHKEAFGGEVLEIDGDQCNLLFDDLEDGCPHYVTQLVPFKAIKRL